MLVIDQNVVHLEIIAEQLASWGNSALAVAGNGAESSHYCRASLPTGSLLYRGDHGTRAVRGYGIRCPVCSGNSGNGAPESNLAIMVLTSAKAAGVWQMRHWPLKALPGEFVTPVRQSQLLDTIMAAVEGRTASPAPANVISWLPDLC